MWQNTSTILYSHLNAIRYNGHGEVNDHRRGDSVNSINAILMLSTLIRFPYILMRKCQRSCMTFCIVWTWAVSRYMSAIAKSWKGICAGWVLSIQFQLFGY